jgi:hypothetical protein
MAEQKTKPTAVSVIDFINKQENEQVRDDCRELVRMMKKVSGSPPKMWGPSIIGFGSYHYKYDSGHEGDSCLAGFAPRKGKLVVYAMGADDKSQTELLDKLGKFKRTKGCIYIKKLEDIDMVVLEKLVRNSVDYVIKKYGK